MNVNNTKVGTLYRDGTVKVDGQTVATDAWVSARFTEGSGFVQVSDGVWARKTTTSFANPSAPVLVHYDANNQVDFAVMVDCGNAVKVTPVKVTPPSKPAALVCNSLTVTAVPGENLTYKFTAQATATNTAITSYVFTFSDGSTKTVTSTATTAELIHAFAENNKKYTVSVAVNSADIKNQTSASCMTSVTTPKLPECKPGVPAGSAACNECKPGVPTGSAQCLPPVTPAVVVTPQPPAPTELINSGPGAVASLFAGTSAIGAVGHRILTRRRLNRA